MKCRKCGHENPDGARFCGYCRSELSQEPGAGMHKNIYVILVVLAIAVGIIVGVFLGRGDARQTEDMMLAVQASECNEESLMMAAAEAYLSVLKEALAENRGVYSRGDHLCRGILRDLDNDGELELVVSNLRMDLSVMGFADAVFSVYDYESGMLNARILQRDFGDFGGAGSNFFITVADQDGHPAIVTYEETGEADGYENNLPDRHGNLVVYSCDNWRSVHEYEIKRIRNRMFFAADDQEVSEKDFLKELDQYSSIRENWDNALTMLELSEVTVPASELMDTLYKMVGPDFGKDTYEEIQTTNDTEDTGVDKYMKLISAGQYHSVAIYEDGTVYAVGRSDRDRADVDHWKNVIAVSAYSHTVGLRSDGTVVASGDWIDGRCNVSDWSDIIDIDTGEDNTIGLKEDGTVYVIGKNEYHQCEVFNWTDIVDVAIGSRTAYGVKSNGQVVAAGGNNSGQRDVGYWSDIIAVSAGPYHVVGLKSDGTVVAEGDNTAHQCAVEGWTDIVAISAGNKFTLGLKEDGTVVVCGRFEDEDLHELNSGKIVAISAGMNHALALTEDGRIIAVGSNDRNQCKIAGSDIF